MTGSLHVVSGGQFGSEGKGAVAAALVRREHARHGWSVSVRVGGPNAGHTAYDDQGRRWALRQIPVGVVVPDSALYIAAGSEVDIEVLVDEANRLEDAGLRVWGRLSVDESATVITKDHKDSEQYLVDSIGSTGKGIGAARADRIMRTAPTVVEADEDWGLPPSLAGALHHGTDRSLRSHLAGGAAMVVEGTQGYGLGLHTDYYPKVTSGDCRAIDFMAQAGVYPPVGGEFIPWVVLRAYPIRVAGNSGPLRNETTWTSLGLPAEYTTVTQKQRRVGEWDSGLAWLAVGANGPGAVVAFTMLDHIHPEVAGANSAGELTFDSRRTIDKVEEELQVPVRYVGTGPETGIFI